MPIRPTVAVCSGRDCRSSPEHDALEQVLRPVADVAAVRCLGVCHSPVVVVTGGGSQQVFERVRTAKRRRALVEYVTRGGPPAKRLAKLAVTGKDKRKAIARIARS